MIQVQRQSNSAVTDYYLDVIAKMCAKDCEIYSKEHPLSECGKDDVIIVPTAIDFYKVYKKGFRKIVYWMQGIDGEESYLKHHSRIRKFILDRFSKFAMKKASAVFFVSDEMKRYEEKKFKIYISKKSFIMPCFNVSKDEGLLFDKEKYNKNVFTYVGSLSEWQCFEKTVEIFKQIEEIYSDAEFKVFTFSKKEAEEILQKKNVKRYSVDCVPPEKMTEALSEVKFGFVIREDIAVNRVATPTKLSSYLSAGVIPIFSDCLKDFYEKTADLTYVLPVGEDFKLPKKLDEFIRKGVEYEKICAEYKGVFDTYYNPCYYVELYKDKLVELLR